MDKKEAEQEALRKAKESQSSAGKNSGMSGRDLVRYFPSLGTRSDSFLVPIQPRMVPRRRRWRCVGRLGSGAIQEEEGRGGSPCRGSPNSRFVTGRIKPLGSVRYHVTSMVLHNALYLAFSSSSLGHHLLNPRYENLVSSHF